MLEQVALASAKAYLWSPIKSTASQCCWSIRNWSIRCRSFWAWLSVVISLSRKAFDLILFLGISEQSSDNSEYQSSSIQLTTERHDISDRRLIANSPPIGEFLSESFNNESTQHPPARLSICDGHSIRGHLGGHVTGPMQCKPHLSRTVSPSDNSSKGKNLLKIPLKNKTNESNWKCSNILFRFCQFCFENKTKINPALFRAYKNEIII